VILIFATPEEARELLGLSTRQPESGPCVHYDERSEYAADADPCTYPYGDGTCPHLDNPEILCPVKDACYAMHEVARMRGVCGAEQVSGQCVYYDERSEHEDDVEQCTYPYEGGCPHLDDEVFCPVKDEWLAESERIEQDLAWAWGDDLPEFVSLAQDPEGRGHDLAAEATDTVPRSDYVLAPRDPQEQVADAEEPEPEFPALEPDDGALHTHTVPATRKPHPNAWSDEEIEVIRRAQSAAEADVSTPSDGYDPPDPLPLRPLLAGERAHGRGAAISLSPEGTDACGRGGAARKGAGDPPDPLHSGPYSAGTHTSIQRGSRSTARRSQTRTGSTATSRSSGSCPGRALRC
jgi:hypothetical protein